MTDLNNRDYTLIIDKSGSMAIRDDGIRSRWSIMQETTLAFAIQCEDFDPDGITVYTFSTRFSRYDNVTGDKVQEIFKENEPCGRTEMANVLSHALENYFHRKRLKQSKSNGEVFLVVTDGCPDNPGAVIDTIIKATTEIEADGELSISFIQIGKDDKATRYLKMLDDDLQSAGARFDIVDTITIDEIENEGISLKEVLIRAITD